MTRSVARALTISFLLAAASASHAIPSFTGLGDLAGGSFFSLAHETSADGSVMVGRSHSASGTEAFRWTAAGGMVGLGDLADGSFLSQAHGTSADGSVVVGRSHSASGAEAFVWDATNGMRELDQVLSDLGLDLTGWTLTQALSVSVDGQTIVGFGTNPSGFTEAWVAVIPEPSTGLLLMTSLISLAMCRRQRLA